MANFKVSKEVDQVGTDIQNGPNANLFVVSLSNGAIYEIFRHRRR